MDCLPAPLTMTLSSRQEQDPRHREELGSATVRSVNVAMQGCLFLPWFLPLHQSGHKPPHEHIPEPWKAATVGSMCFSRAVPYDLPVTCASP